MKDSAKLRLAARYIKRNGFSPGYRVGNTNCGCFAHAIYEVCQNAEIVSRLWDKLSMIVGTDNVAPQNLILSGWTEGCTDDAAAACRIAADICECEGN